MFVFALSLSLSLESTETHDRLLGRFSTERARFSSNRKALADAFEKCEQAEEKWHVDNDQTRDGASAEKSADWLYGVNFTRGAARAPFHAFFLIETGTGTGTLYTGTGRGRAS